MAKLEVRLTQEIRAALKGRLTKNARERLTQRLASLPVEQRIGRYLVVAMLSRERAKLGSLIGAATTKRNRCPDCGGVVTAATLEIAQQHLNCTSQQWRAKGAEAEVAMELARLIAGVWPNNAYVKRLLGFSALRQAGANRRHLAGDKDTLVDWSNDDPKKGKKGRKSKQDSESDQEAELSEAERIKQRESAARFDQPLWQAVSAARFAVPIVSKRWLAAHPEQAPMWEGQSSQPGGDKAISTPLGRVIAKLTVAVVRELRKPEPNGERIATLCQALVGLAVSLAHPGRDTMLAQVCRLVYKAALRHTDYKSGGSTVRSWVRNIVLTLEPDSQTQNDLIAQLTAMKLTGEGSSEWEAFNWGHKRIMREAGKRQPRYGEDEKAFFDQIHATPEGVRWKDHLVGAVGAAGVALDALANMALQDGGLYEDKPCGRPLHYVTASPRRIALARYISHHAPHIIDMYIFDEAHQLAGENSAQRIAAYRLMMLGKPFLLLTGTWMRGYADCAFYLMYAISREFRQKYAYKDITKFTDEFGYFLREVEAENEDDEDDSNAAAQSEAYGAMSDRRMPRRARKLGLLPGINDKFILDLLSRAATINLEKLGIHIPDERIIGVPVRPADDDLLGQEMFQATIAFQEGVRAQIRRDMFTPLRGMLFGALSRSARALDLAIRGCSHDRDEQGNEVFAARYPVSAGGKIVAKLKLFPQDSLTPKERALIAILRKEKAEGRPCVVFVSDSGKGSGLMQRLEGLLTRHAHLKVVVLNASEVGTWERATWIDKHVVKAKADVLIVNPTAVDTGLNNLICCKSAVWYQDNGCKAAEFIQANARLRRPEQDVDEVRIYVLYNAGELQEGKVKLGMGKVYAAKRATKGEGDAEINAVGVTGDTIAHGTLGQQLYKMMENKGLVEIRQRGEQAESQVPVAAIGGEITDADVLPEVAEAEASMEIMEIATRPDEANTARESRVGTRAAASFGQIPTKPMLKEPAKVGEKSGEQTSFL